MDSLQTAHQHAANAEDYRNQGLLIPASEEHMKAAEAFHACEEKSQDANVCMSLCIISSAPSNLQCLSDKNDAPYAIQ
jgi:hypothetical protein